MGIFGKDRPRQYRNAAAGMPGFDGEGKFDLAVGFLRGYRWWTMPQYQEKWAEVVTGYPVGSLNGATGHRWTAGRMEAKCSGHADHKPPQERDPKTRHECGCGFWAYWDYRSHSLTSGSWRVSGVIEGTGRALVGDAGFRCQYARIVALRVEFDDILRPYLNRIPRRYPRSDTMTVGGATLRRGGIETFRALTGAQYYDRSDPDLDRELQEAEMAAHETAGKIESRLTELYPEAEIFASERMMLMKYPPIGKP